MWTHTYDITFTRTAMTASLYNKNKFVNISISYYFITQHLVTRKFMHKNSKLEMKQYQKYYIDINFK